MKTKTLLLGSAVAALTLAAPAMLRAQQLPAPVIAVVNIEQIAETCTACTAANAQLQTQGNALQARVQALQQEIQTETQALQPLVNAIPAGGQPDAALAARLQGYQQRQQNAEREIGVGRERIQRNIAFVRQQIAQRLRPAITTVMQQRGATLVVDRGSVIDAAPALDITPAVLAIVNQNTAPLNVNAPTQAPAGAQPPAGTRPPAQPQPNRPRPQGR
ncbi:MAG TPA: OmpH family outer membrane protein [Allosphingosinicella sp.]|nr:OmpH family outer membrane protein [Allosphingosinicella sp.]